MIKLEIVHHADLRLVMNEFAALVKKGGVILVAFNNEPWTVREPRALAEIVRDAADEIAGIQSVVFEHPCQQRRRRGFAMRARDHNRTLAANEKFLEQFRQ
jgi:hypothetical protein